MHLLPSAPSRAPSRVAAADNVLYTSAPWLCTYSLYGCQDPAATNYRDPAIYSNDGLIDAPGLCQYAGCNDTDASNYNSEVRANSPVAPHYWTGRVIAARARSRAARTEG